MKRLYTSALFLCIFLSISAQEIIWQKDIKSSTQDFLSQITTTIDQQYLITGSTIPFENLRDRTFESRRHHSTSSRTGAISGKTEQRLRFPFD